MGMHRCKTLEGLRLYSSLSITTKDLARLATHRACARSEGSTPRLIQSRYWSRQSCESGALSISIGLVHGGGLEVSVHGLGLIRRGVPARGLGIRGARFRRILEIDGGLGDVASKDVRGDGGPP